MKVTILVKNRPSWELLPLEQVKFYEKLSVLPYMNCTWDEMVFQGDYGGLQVETEEEIIRICKSWVEVISKIKILNVLFFCECEVRRFCDYHRDLEKWIFSTGKDLAPYGIYNQVYLQEFDK